MKPCARCQMPNIDPATAAVDPVVTDTLQGYRSDPRVGGGITFAMNAIIVAGIDSTLRVGLSATGNFRFD